MADTANLGSTKPVSEHDENKVAAYNQLADEFDAAIGGLVEVTVNTANVTLTRTQALNKVFKFTGTLTGNRAIIFPATLGTARSFIVWNATSGAFTLTIRHAGSGVAVTQTHKQLLFTDLTTIYAAAASIA